MPRPTDKVLDVLHPSNLGKLNGAINASANAKLAHIRNGNFTGPVGMAAALALADYNYSIQNEAFLSASRALELAAAFAVIDGAPSEEELAAASALIAEYDRPTEDEILAAEAFVATATDDTDAGALAAAQETLQLAAAYNVVTSAPSEEELAAASAIIEGAERPTEEEFTAAQAIVDAGEPTDAGVIDAESALLASYKGTLDEDAKARLLEALKISLPSPEQISEAIRASDIVEEPALVQEPDILIEDTAALSE
ncbi:hypothetical protein EYC08_11130 [Tabrizicola sp. WMC-M-20]|nr:hypothetical protein EYC08_11130 [Tabrizicola sp. WMC-M-20]